MSTAAEVQKVQFIQSDVPPMRVGNYTLKVTQKIPKQDPGEFSLTNTFVVEGQRFSFPQDYINSVFPPENSNGEYDGVFPHVVFNRRTLPWERVVKINESAPLLAHGRRSYRAADGYEEHSWLAILLFNDDQAPVVQKKTAKELVVNGTKITVSGSGFIGVGTLPSNILSYSTSTLSPMGYGESPDDACNIIDIPLSAFNAVAPSIDDLFYLAHIREVDAADGVDTKDDKNNQLFSVVVGNRIPIVNIPTHAYLVSFENFADYLPDANGKQSSHIPAGIDTVRLLCYRAWSYTANDLDQKLENLLENLNKKNGVQELTTLQLPIVGAAPSKDSIEAAMKAEDAGSLSAPQADVLIKNAFAMGYVPFDHHLRHGGNTVSFYRGPLSPYPIANTLKLPIAGPDKATRYDARTGLFDVSYSIAWQIGQLMALQNSGFANDLLEWRRTQTQQSALQAEQEFIDNLFKGQIPFESIMRPRQRAIQAMSTDLPDSITQWLGTLASLQNIPFNYLVPDERLLPPESLRYFYLDFNWLDALIDGAFSIGRTTSQAAKVDAIRMQKIRHHAYQAMFKHRKNSSRVSASIFDGTNIVTGFLMRSQAVSGWPNLRYKGYDSQGNELNKLHVFQLAKDVSFVLFNGEINKLVVEEPPEQLHLGVEGCSGTYSTTLREIHGDNPGVQYPDAIASISTREDEQTVQIALAADSIQKS